MGADCMKPTSKAAAQFGWAYYQGPGKMIAAKDNYKIDSSNLCRTGIMDMPVLSSHEKARW